MIIVYGGIRMIALAEARGVEAQNAMSQTNQANANAQIRAQFIATKDQRASIDALVGMDIVSIVNTIEDTGIVAGVGAKVINAESDVNVIKIGNESLRAVLFRVEATGSYAALAHLVELYERLPMLASIDQIDIERQGDARAGTWNMIVRIRVFTNSPVTI
jgi:Tfp pilus assembly protein PilO